MTGSTNKIAQETLFLAQVASKVVRIGGWSIQLSERTLMWSDNKLCEAVEEEFTKWKNNF